MLRYRSTLWLGLALLPISSAHVQEANASYSVPANYRQLVARRILETTDRKKIRKARISRPVEQWAGLISGGFRPSVCVEVIRESLLFSNARDVWAVTFQDGKVASIGPSKGECGRFFPFDELLKR
jgi:hypothetical protein